MEFDVGFLEYKSNAFSARQVKQLTLLKKKSRKKIAGQSISR